MGGNAFRFPKGGSGQSRLRDSAEEERASRRVGAVPGRSVENVRG